MIKSLNSKHSFIAVVDPETTVEEVLSILEKKGMQVQAISTYEPSRDVWNQGRNLHLDRESPIYQAPYNGGVLWEITVLFDEVPEFQKNFNKAARETKKAIMDQEQADAEVIANDAARELADAQSKLDDLKEKSEAANKAAGID